MKHYYNIFTGTAPGMDSYGNNLEIEAGNFLKKGYRNSGCRPQQKVRLVVYSGRLLMFMISHDLGEFDQKGTIPHKNMVPKTE